MAASVSPAAFSLISFDAGEIASVAEAVAATVGLPADLPIEIMVDESSILTRGTVSTGSDPAVRIAVAGGAFEDRARPRRFSEETCRIELTRLLQRVADRRTPAFAGAPAEGELSLAEEAAWDVTALGRASRRGLEVFVPRLRYDFQLRFGFGADTDARFDRLWSLEDPTWADVASG